LSERIEDIPLLCQHFIDNYNRENGGKVEHLNDEALKLLADYHWPGNIRELNIVIERACTDARKGIITVDNLLRFSNESTRRKTEEYSGFDIKEAKREAEKATIIRALKASNGNRTRAAQLLGISRSSLYNKMEQLNMEII